MYFGLFGTGLSKVTWHDLFHSKPRWIYLAALKHPPLPGHLMMEVLQTTRTPVIFIPALDCFMVYDSDSQGENLFVKQEP